MNEYFYIDKATNQQCGPFTVNELKTKNITSDTMVWCSGMADWTTANNVSELSVLFSAQQPNSGYQAQTAVNTNPAPVQTQQQQSNMYDNNVYGQRRPMNNGNNLKDVYPMPKTWLVESILVTIMCCMPFGIAAILKATKVESLYYAGDYEAAEEASKEAKKWTIVGFISFFVVIILYFLFYFVIIGAAIGLDSLQY